VEIFREWYGCSLTLPWSILHGADISRLQGQVTDLETEAATPLPILNPSVRVILLAHSAGLVDLCLVFSRIYDTDAPAHSGLVASDTLFSVLDHRPVSADPDVKLMFPLIHGLMAFDTPYNGLSSSMFAYGAFSQYHNLSSIWSWHLSRGAVIQRRDRSSINSGTFVETMATSCVTYRNLRCHYCGWSSSIRQSRRDRPVTVQTQQREDLILVVEGQPREPVPRDLSSPDLCKSQQHWRGLCLDSKPPQVRWCIDEAGAAEDKT
jgi:hypothetical protein